MTKSVSKSRFRPGAAPDATIFQQHAPLLREIERRGLLRGSLSLGALAMLGGCSPKDSDTIQATLRAISRFNDRVQAWLFDPTKLAPTYPESMVVKPPRFNAFYEVGDVQPVDGTTWKLELAGRIAERQPWTVPQIMALPEQEIIIRHICVEGWDYIGQWSGVPLRLFLERVGADLSCRYVAFRCADGYWGSIDMASALHPQTLLATKYAREAIADPFGYPLRLRTAVKLGFKNPKWITSIEVTNDYPGGYWEDRGFNWFSGL
ncbi:molybdopterin-dependent oxidoreductase [Roseococcus sp.]|uniref:molybdopterin-dependent oxidoreductase n=1 Tax=Roseococcus sp. TaxID=2109646 RepID=UPI003BAB8B3A